MDLQLQGKRALVTGSSKGIGAAIASFLAAEGVIVMVHGRDQEATKKVAADIVQRGSRAHAVIGDLTDEKAAERIISESESTIGAIEILVNNAGGSGPKETWETTGSSAWSSTYDRNVIAAVRMITRVLPKMRQAKWGRVINVSSLAGTMPPTTGPDYSAAKAAMNAMTLSLSKAVAAEGITVNNISPGTILSPKLEARFREVATQRGIANSDAPWEQIEQAVLPLFAEVPIGRVGQMREIAAAAAFLASPVAAYITGFNLRVDGGASTCI